MATRCCGEAAPGDGRAGPPSSSVTSRSCATCRASGVTSAPFGTASREPGANARRLAIIAAATVLCGELSLLAAQTNPGELMAAHLRLERGK